ncbi:hypothetical protein ANRL2_01171 [Anaerolineae bacterium]|nr:hypothetical protein ANRL2_01171 [Anaerolineae bacterium]
MAQEEIVLRLTPEEINLLLEGIGNLPFVKVYTLVGKIQAQASAQLGGGANPAEPPDAGQA